MSATLKTLVQPITGQTFKMGRRRRIGRPMGLRLGNYLKRSFPKMPDSVDYYHNAAACLNQVMLNDQLGDCTAAGVFHIAGVFLGNAGQPITFPDAMVEKFYSLTSGYVPGNESTDNGCDEVTVLNYWREKGLDGQGSHRIAGHLSVNADDPEEVRAALYLFENVYFGIELPDAWVNPGPEGNGFVFDVAGDPVPDNGHCYIGFGYNDNGVRSSTWGMQGLTTFAAIKKYAVDNAGGELHAVISQDALIKATQKTPSGVDWSGMIANFEAMGGSLTNPALVEDLNAPQAAVHTIG